MGVQLSVWNSRGIKNGMWLFPQIFYSFFEVSETNSEKIMFLKNWFGVFYYLVNPVLCPECSKYIGWTDKCSWNLLISYYKVIRKILFNWLEQVNSILFTVVLEFWHFLSGNKNILLLELSVRT